MLSSEGELSFSDLEILLAEVNIYNTYLYTYCIENTYHIKYLFYKFSFSIIRLLYAHQFFRLVNANCR